MNRHPLLIIFAKAPRLGTVKTRLARHVGNGAALNMYRRMLAETLSAAGQVPARLDVRLVVTPDRFASRGNFWPRGIETGAQGIGDLGQRMGRQFLSAGRDRHVVLVGSDIPQMTGPMLQSAFGHLAGGQDGVFGPSEDGGFWLVGFRAGRYTPRMFRNIRWSHSETYRDVRSALPSHYRIAEVETLNDIDDLSDYQRYISTR